jgi:Phospholipid-translocating P-type ATPase C-terminal
MQKGMACTPHPQRLLKDTHAPHVQAFLDAAVCFFVPFLAASPTGHTSATDIFAVGKTINICMLGIVTMEIMIVARYWTWWFAAVAVLSYALVYPFVLVFPLFQQAIDSWDMGQFGVGENIMRMPYFWISLITVYSMTFSIRYFERSTKWLFRPDDNMIRAELEVIDARESETRSSSSRSELASDPEDTGANGASPSAPPPRPDPAADPDVRSAAAHARPLT